MATDVMIEAKGLSKLYGPFRALDKVSFQVKRGEVVGFLGPNGAGKSTTMRILTCFISATGGTAKVHGLDVFDDPLEVRRKIGYLPQRAPLYGEMTVWDYLQFTSDMRGLDPSTFKSRMKRIVEVCGLAKVLGKDIRQLSHGYRQRVGLGQALVHDPPILILDEPTSDLDPNEKAEVIRYIQEIGKDRTVLLSTHNLAEVEAACARAIIVSKGRVVADGPLSDIRSKSGTVRYIVKIHEQKLYEGSEGYRAGSTRRPPTSDEVSDALAKLSGVQRVRELPTDDQAHAFELSGELGGDLREAIFQLVVQKGWLLLEMRRESQTLEDVFKALTRGDERADRGRPLLADDDDGAPGAATAAAGAVVAASAGDEDEDGDDDGDDDEKDGDDDAADENDDGDEKDDDGDEKDDDDDGDDDGDDDDDDDDDAADDAKGKKDGR